MVTVMSLAMAPGYAQIAPGEYVGPGGMASIRISPDKTAGLRFHLTSRGGNFHMCELSGVIRNGESRMEDSADPKLPCIVTFRRDKTGIEVGSKYPGTCSTYCGARAHFEMTYAVPPPDCAPSQIRHTRNLFKTAYDKKQFSEARALLSPIAEKCGNVLNDIDEAWVRNDLALTLYRMGDHAACRETLKPWLELAQTPDEQIKGDYPPSDAEEMLRIAGATRANFKICGAPVTVGGKGKSAK